MENLVTQLGVGGVFMVLTFRELLQFLRGYRASKAVDPAGERPTEYWLQQFTTIVASSATAPVMQRISESQEKVSESLIIMARHLEENSDSVRRLSDNIVHMNENIVRLLERRQGNR